MVGQFKQQSRTSQKRARQLENQEIKPLKMGQINDSAHRRRTKAATQNC
jgi:hypothetical protein